MVVLFVHAAHARQRHDSARLMMSCPNPHMHTHRNTSQAPLINKNNWITPNQSSLLVNGAQQSRNSHNLKDHFVRAVPLLEGELRVQVCLQHGVCHSRQDLGVDGLLVGLARVGHRGGLPKKGTRGEVGEKHGQGDEVKASQQTPSLRRAPSRRWYRREGVSLLGRNI